MLETKIIPAYYNKENINTYSLDWIKYMKNSIATNAGMYSTSRMLIDYLKRIYMPLIEINDSKFNSLEQVFDLLKWKKMCYEEWKNIKIYQDTQIEQETLDAGENIRVSIRVHLGRVALENAKVQIYIAELIEDGKMKYLKSEELKFANKNDDGTCTYVGDITINNGGNFVYTFRVLPKHEMILDIEDMDLSKWYMKEN